MYSVEATKATVADENCADFNVTITRMIVGLPTTTILGKVSVWYFGDETQIWSSGSLTEYIASRKEEAVRFELYRLIKEAIADAAVQAQSWDEAAADAAALGLIEAERAREEARWDAWLSAARAAESPPL